MFALNKKQNDVEKVIAVCRAVAEGNFEARVTGVNYDSQVGELALAVNAMIDRTDAFMREATASLDYVSQNRYFRRILENGMLGAFGTAARKINGATSAIAERVGGFKDTIGQFEEMTRQEIDRLEHAARELESAAETMDQTARLSAEQASSVAAAAEQTATNVETVASAAEELNASINEISSQIARSTEVTQTAVIETSRVSELMTRLEGEAAKIGEVIELIGKIAAQTNLLALNATIEAARAGEAGKGFAVVASEVKSLANQTGQATGQIEDQIASIQAATTDAVQAIGTIVKTINDVGQISTTIAAAIEEQGSATSEIARNITEASKGTVEVTRNIAGVSEAVRQTGDLSAGVKAASGALGESSQSLTGEFSSFINAVRKVV
jgi:methyl-accepting chemotaxis protein